MKTLKNALIIGTFVLASTTLCAESFIGVSSSINSSEDVKLFDAQPFGEIVGSGGVYNQLQYGITAGEDKKSRIFGYIWNNQEKNNEIGFGIGADFVGGTLLTPKLSYLIGGEVGYGWQPVNGDTANVSTNANKLDFVTVQNPVYTPTTITYKDDTAVLEIKLNLGLTYEISNNWTADCIYSYRASNYQVSYVNADSPTVLNQMTEKQDNHSLALALNYKF